MVNETKKSMHDSNLFVAATCVRLPVFNSHAESIAIEVDKDNLSFENILSVLKGGKGIVLEDDPNSQTYPTPLRAANKKDVFVGRVRKDLDNDRGFHLWVVSDNLLKGVVWNSVEIDQSLISKGYL